MSSTTYIETLPNAHFGEYAGARTPSHFGDAVRELAALRSGCGVFDLSWRSKVVITGEDRIRWANGMFTNNIRDLRPGRGNYSFVLNAQGRIQADATVFHRGDHLLLLTEAAQLARLVEYLNKYIIMDDVEITDVSEKLAAIGVAGPKAEETLRAAGLLQQTLEPGEVAEVTIDGIGLSVARSPIEKLDGYEIWLATENFARVWDRLVAAGAVPAGSTALEFRRILAAIPRVGIDIGERELPQETTQDYALHYSKGCYIGQEIVERIHSRGNVHRGFSAIEVQGPSPTRGTKIMSGDKEVGEVTTVAEIPLDGGSRTIALAFLRREAAAPGTSLKVGDATATTVATPL